jgi:putative ABC transport system ATP-binding protein
MTTPATQSLIRLDQVEKKFFLDTETVHALKNVNFGIPKQSFSIIYGPSGSGKSTLLNTIVGLEVPTSGKVTIENQDLYSLNADQRANFRARTLGMVYQTNYWVNSLTVLENVCMPLFLSGYSKHQAAMIAKESLEMVGMAAYFKKRPTVLSGGQQQRVSMARAIVANPDLIVADEPTGNLDTKNGDMIMNLLSDLNHKLHKTIILVTHNLEYLSLSTHRVQIKDGMASEDDGSYGLTSEEKKDKMKRLQENFIKQAKSGEKAPTIAEMTNQLSASGAAQKTEPEAVQVPKTGTTPNIDTITHRKKDDA